jgi:hypothetical protein
MKSPRLKSATQTQITALAVTQNTAYFNLRMLLDGHYIEKELASRLAQEPDD